MIYIVNEDAPGLHRPARHHARRGGRQYRHLPPRPPRGGRRGGRPGLGRRPYRRRSWSSGSRPSRREEGEAAALLNGTARHGRHCAIGRIVHAPCPAARRLAPRRAGGRAARARMADARRRMTCCSAPSPTSRASIRLRAGRPVKLRFVNQGRATLSFSAPRLLRAPPGSARATREHGPRRQPPPRARASGVTIALVPAPGRYRARSRNLVHRLLGMSAAILVE